MNIDMMRLNKISLISSQLFVTLKIRQLFVATATINSIYTPVSYLCCYYVVSHSLFSNSGVSGVSGVRRCEKNTHKHTEKNVSQEFRLCDNFYTLCFVSETMHIILQYMDNRKSTTKRSFETKQNLSIRPRRNQKDKTQNQYTIERVLLWLLKASHLTTCERESQPASQRTSSSHLRA